MRKVFWGGVIVAVLAAVGIFWIARWASRSTEAHRTRWSAGVAHHSIPEGVLWAFREMTTPGFIQRQMQANQGHEETTTPNQPTITVPAQEVIPAEPVEVIRVEPWSEELTEAVKANLIEGPQVSQSTQTVTPDTGEGEVVVTAPATSRTGVTHATAHVLPMPYAEEDQDKSQPATETCPICAWLLEVFRTAVEQAANQSADRVMPRIEDEEEEMPEEENEEEVTDPSARPDQGCPDYHRHHRGCPYMQGCPYPYHCPRPAWQPAGPNREEIGEPRETPMQPATPVPMKPRRMSRATLRQGGFIDTMEYRPGDGPDYRFQQMMF